MINDPQFLGLLQAYVQQFGPEQVMAMITGMINPQQPQVPMGGPSPAGFPVPPAQPPMSGPFLPPQQFPGPHKGEPGPSAAQGRGYVGPAPTGIRKQRIASGELAGPLGPGHGPNAAKRRAAAMMNPIDFRPPGPVDRGYPGPGGGPMSPVMTKSNPGPGPGGRGFPGDTSLGLGNDPSGSIRHLLGGGSSSDPFKNKGGLF